MKKLLILPFLGMTFYGFTLFEVNIFDFHHLFGSCSGSNAYCNVCKNCNYCGHCAKSEGTCAVCYTRSAVPGRSDALKTYRPEKSVSSNNTHSVHSGIPAMKRLYLQKSSTRKRSSTITTPVDRPETESFSTVDNKEPNVKSDNFLITKTELADNQQSINVTPVVPEKKESFTIDIPENADFVRITSSSAHLREQFHIKSRILQTLNHGDLLIKLKSVKGWVKVQALDSGEIGYVFGGLLK